MINGSSGGGVVDKSTPHGNADKSNNYVHICTISYLNQLVVVLE